MALKRQKKGVESAAGINVPNSFYDFESESMIYLHQRIKELRIAAEYFGGDSNILPTFTINTKY
jgi:hypothetical protein